MGLKTHYLTILLTFVAISSGSKDPLKDAVLKQKVINARERPRIPDTFQVEVEGIFKDSMTEADGRLYFDRPNNIAAMEVLWQKEFGRKIYSFDTNELIVIKGYDCDVKKIPDKPDESFFPFTIDPDSGRKILGTAEQALYFQNSKYIQDFFDGSIETYMYKVNMDFLMYGKKDCSVIHHFLTVPNFTPSNCDSRFCDPVLSSINVCCPGAEEQIEGEILQVCEVDHIYRFFSFIDSIENENAFHPPSGVYCDRKNSKSFPTLPTYFSFTYDVTENAVQVKNAGGLKILHKKVWYDGDLQFIRVDAFDDKGFLQVTRIYDFYNGMTYSEYLKLNVTTRTELDTKLSLQLITLLPPEVFPRPIHKSGSSPLFVGLRKLHGIEYHVWSVMNEGGEYNPKAKSVTELYFQAIISEKDGEIIKEVGQQLSFIEEYTYTPDEDTGDTELSKTTFVPINNFRSSSRDFSAFDVSRWFDKGEKKAFELDIIGPELIAGTRSYSDFLEQLYLEIVTLGEFSIIRISKLEIKNRNSASNTTTFSGWILENPSILGYNTKNNESDLNTTFSVLENLIRERNLEFEVDDEDGVTQTFVLSSFRQAKTRNKDKSEKNNNGDRTYSGGVVAGAAFGMLAFGLFISFIVISASDRKRAGKSVLFPVFSGVSTVSNCTKTSV